VPGVAQGPPNTILSRPAVASDFECLEQAVSFVRPTIEYADQPTLMHRLPNPSGDSPGFSTSCLRFGKASLDGKYWSAQTPYGCEALSAKIIVVVFLLPKQLFYSPDVIAMLKKVGGKGNIATCGRLAGFTIPALSLEAVTNSGRPFWRIRFHFSRSCGT